MKRAKRLVTRRTILRAGAAASATLLIRKSALAAPAPLVVDVHSHNFNASDLPVSGFAAHVVPFLADVSREVTAVPESVFRWIVGEVQSALRLTTPTAAEELASLTAGAPWPAAVADSADARQAADKVLAGIEWLADRVDKKVDLAGQVHRAAQVVNLTIRGRAEITATMAHTYPSVGLFVPMLVDYDGWTAPDNAKSPLGDQIRVQGAIGRKSAAMAVGPGAARVHPFVAFDPLRADGLDLVKVAIEQEGFIGVKVYPPVGFAAARNECLLPDKQRGKAIDQALDALYAYCATNDVPITTHCSAANEFGLGYRDLVAPHRWEPVLQRFNKLRLNLGHFGHSEGVDAKRGFQACEAWIRQATYLMNQYENVYADLSGSAFNESDDVAGSYAKLVQKAFSKYGSVPKRLMYGSDWWLNRFFEGAPVYFETFRTSFAKLFPGRNDLLADVLGNNAIRFLGLGGGARTRNADRLVRVYQAAHQPVPPWLAG